jgi:hypothetical protein
MDDEIGRGGAIAPVSAIMRRPRTFAPLESLPGRQMARWRTPGNSGCPDSLAYVIVCDLGSLKI